MSVIYSLIGNKIITNNVKWWELNTCNENKFRIKWRCSVLMSIVVVVVVVVLLLVV